MRSTSLGLGILQIVIDVPAIVFQDKSNAIGSEVAVCLERIGLGNHYRITLNSVEVFNGVAEHLRLDGGAREVMRHLMDIRDAAELRRFLSSFTDEVEDCAAFSRLTQLTGKREILDEARRIITNERIGLAPATTMAR